MVHTSFKIALLSSFSISRHFGKSAVHFNSLILHLFSIIIYDLGKKNESLSGGHISVKSQSILKNYMRFGITKEFPTIWDSAKLCSFIRLEVMIKNVVPEIEEISFCKKLSTFMGDISVKSQSILKNFEVWNCKRISYNLRLCATL